MGRIVVAVSVSNTMDPVRQIAFEALVDTGAYALTLPLAWRAQLEPMSLVEEVQLVLADQSVTPGYLCGPVTITVPGFATTVAQVLFMEMDQRDGRYEPLLGYLTLEQLRIAVDMVGHRLVKIPHVDLKAAHPAATASQSV